MKPHWEARLRGSCLTILRFMTSLLKVGMVRCLRGGSAKEEVGMFLVKKAGNNTIWFIFDVRRVSQRYRQPQGAELCFLEGFLRAEIELPKGVERESAHGWAMLDLIPVYLGNGDVKDAFHRFHLRRAVSKWF